MLAITIGILAAGGTYLLLQRSLVQIVFGIALISHAVNFALLAAGVLVYRQEPLHGSAEIAQTADPLPQAFVLTSIVITLAVIVVMLMLAVFGHNDDTHRPPHTGEDPER